MKDKLFASEIRMKQWKNFDFEGCFCIKSARAGSG